MSSAQLFYAINLLIYAGVDIIACLGLNQQFGVAGVTNFGFIIFQAAGAYTAAILSLPNQSANGAFQSYIGGWNLPWPVPWIGAMIVGGLIALPFTFLVGRRLRGDFAAVGLLVTAVMANLLITNYRPLLNGSAGLSLVPAPLQGEYNPQSQGYQWLYAAVTLVLAAAIFLLRRVTESPYGRSLRAMRDNDIVADSLRAPGLADATRQDGSAVSLAGRPITRSVPSSVEPDEGVVLRTVDVTRDFGGVHAVAGVSIEVQRGTLTGLIGPNGAGKSTLLAMLAGTMPVTSGQVIYAGADVTGGPAYRRARLGLVRTFQLASEFKRLTVMENLLSAVPVNRGDSLAGALRGRHYWRRDEEAAITRARALLDRFGLSGYADTYASDLSGGQRRLTEIMRALMTEPTMLLLDEPMAGVHPRLARQIGVQLLGLCAEGMTILMVEHELAIMDEFCDPAIVMAEGTVLATGTMAALRARAEVVEAYLVG